MPVSETKVYRMHQGPRNAQQGHLPPVLAQLADLVHDNALLDLVQGHGRCAQLGIVPSQGRQVQHTLSEHQHRVQMA